MDLPPGLTPAPLDPERLDELTEFVQRVSVAETGRKHITRQDLELRVSRPDFDAERDALLLRDGRGELAAVEFVSGRPPFISYSVFGFVAPERWGEGIGSALLGWARGAVESRLEEAPEGARVTMVAGVDARHRPSLELMRSMGMELVRYFLEMRIDFREPPPAPRFPGGVEVRNFRPGEDDEVVYRAIDEAFRDHFGHAEVPLEAGLERFRHSMDSPEFDPSLWWVAREGDQVAGAILCKGSVEGDPAVGYVGNLSVRKPWRGRGIAKALLLLSFGELHGRGKQAVTLHVDAENPTGATRLYEAVGMRETDRYAHFEMEIRPGEELAVR